MSRLFAPASSSPPMKASSSQLQEYTLLSSSSSAPPTVEQLATLTALPAGLVRPRLRRNRKGKGKKGVSDGAVIAKMYNTVGPRPFPPLSRLTQTIRVTDETSSILLTTSTTIPVFGFQSFILNQFASAAEYTSLFDQYCIESLEVWIEPAVAQGTTVFENLITVVDLDDANTPVNYDGVLRKQGALEGNGGAGRYHRWVPHIAIATYSGAFTSFSNSPSSWIDSASPSVQHYGIKAAANPTLTSQVFNMRIRATIAFRSPGL